MKPIALGFRAHTGWAALVAAAGTPGAIEILLRRRLELLPPSAGISRFVYHTASEMEFKEASALVRKAIDATRKATSKAVREVIAELKPAGFEVVAAAVPGSTAKPPTDLAAILASHSYIHSAEGELFRQALVTACEAYGLKVLTLRERDVWRDAASSLGLAAGDLQGKIDGLKKSVGSPWSQDQKIATAAALLALSLQSGDKAAKRAKTGAR